MLIKFIEVTDSNQIMTNLTKLKICYKTKNKTKEINIDKKTETKEFS